MSLRTDGMDVWIFSRDTSGSVRDLLLHTSQAKADHWFNGGRFWQIAAALRGQGESVVAAGRRCVAELGFAAKSLWAVEHVYAFYNPHFDSLMLQPVFAAEVAADVPATLDWEHSEARWCSSECRAFAARVRAARESSDHCFYIREG